MEIKLTTLENIPLSEIVTVFNLSFSDYIVPVHFSIEQLEQKILADNIDLSLSVGAFQEDIFISFILNAIDCIENVKTAYNAGTGVIPAERGKKISEKLYEFNIEILKRNSIKQIVLEVITTNSYAINLYERMGFKICNVFNCYQGEIEKSTLKSNFEIRKMSSLDRNQLDDFLNFTPSWQNSNRAIENLKNQITVIGAFDKEELVGCLVYNPSTNKTMQFGVKNTYVHEKLEQALFEYISIKTQKEVYINNIGENFKETNETLISIGLSCFIQQYEMKLVL